MSDALDGFLIVFPKEGEVFVAPVVFLEVFEFLIRQEFVEDEAENVVLVFVGFDLGAHFVGRLPDFRGELLLVHKVCLPWQGPVSLWRRMGSRYDAVRRVRC